MSFLSKLVVWAIACLACCDAVDDSGCGTTKMCVRNRDGCNLTDPTCLFFSYVWDPMRNNFLIEMSGGSGDGSQYNGVGFSPSGLMENADVYLCIGTELKSGVVGERHTPPVLDANLTEGVTNVSASTLDGVGKCAFRRTANITKNINESSTYNFNLLTMNYFVIQAYGDYLKAAPAQHNYSNRWRTNAALNFSVTETVQTTPMPEVTTSTNPDPAEGCGESNKGCFRHPDSCTLGTSSCMFVSWTYSSSSELFDFEMIGGSGLERQYAAFAFASSRQMQDADLYYCTATDLVSGAIRERQQPPTAFNNTSGLTNLMTGTYNNVLRCSMTRIRSITKEISGGENKIFDLVDEKFYVLYAVGHTREDGSLTPHNPNSRFVSESAVEFYSGSSALSFNLSLLGAQMMLFITIWMTSF